MSKIEEQAVANLAHSGLTPGEQLDAYLKQRELDRVMQAVVNDHRGGSIHDLPTTHLPQRKVKEPEFGPKGFAPESP